MIADKKRKEVSLESKTISALEQQAKQEGRSLKNYMEYILRQKANNFELTTSYKKDMDAMLQKHQAGKNKYQSKAQFLAKIK